VFPVPAAKDPAGACVQELAPAVLLKKPAGHGVADVAPIVSTKEPAGAGVQGSSPVALNVPAAHGVAAETVSGVAATMRSPIISAMSSAAVA
jgi:hypothetical protein